MNTEIQTNLLRKYIGVIIAYALVKVEAGKDNAGTTYLELTYRDKEVADILAFGSKSKKINIFGDDPKTGLPQSTIDTLQKALDEKKPFPVAEINLESYECTGLPRFAHKYSVSKKFVNGTSINAGDIATGEDGLPRWETSMKVTVINDNSLGIHETARQVCSRMLHNKAAIALDNSTNVQGEAKADVAATAEGADVEITAG